jgi:hypothetical protein
MDREIACHKTQDSEEDLPHSQRSKRRGRYFRSISATVAFETRPLAPARTILAKRWAEQFTPPRVRSSATPQSTRRVSDDFARDCVRKAD